MKQKTCRLQSREEFLAWVEKIKSGKDFKTAEEILIKVMTAQFREGDAKGMYAALKENFPNAKIIGTSMTNFGHKRSDINSEQAWVTSVADLSENYAVISIFYFFSPSTKIKIFDVDVSEIMNSVVEMVTYLKNKLKTVKNLKGVEILCSQVSGIFSDGLSLLAKEFEDIPFFGVVAGTSYKDETNCKYHNIVQSFQNQDVKSFILGNEYHKEGVVFTAYGGEDLHIKANYTLGWKAIGKKMTVTETLGINGLSKIDNIPAVEIYKKYLNIVPNEHLMFNVFEFPLLVDRGGLEFARVPSIYDESGRLYFNTDIRKGEKICLSYGNSVDLLRESEKVGREFKKFDPQAIQLYICGARTIFLNTDYFTEIQFFKKVQQETVYCFGNGEIYKFNDKGGVAGSAIISVAFREGPARSFSVYNAPKFNESFEGIVPLAKRLAAFLEATTDELKNTNENLKNAVIAAESANKSKSQFLSNMSHEIRTPINAILGMNEMILRESEDQNILEYAENIRSAGNSLLGIVNDILDFSKIEAGKMDIIPVEYSLSSLLNDLVNMVQKRAEDKNLEFYIEADENLPSDLFGDEIRIKQIITNILTNAVKYTEKGSVTLKVNFKKISDEKILLCVSVKDTGIGIKAEDLKKLFSAFERIEEKRNRTIEGTGLGMNITQRLLEMMNSKLEVSSVYGEGSEFYFEIEQKIINDYPIGNFVENYRHSLSQHKKYKEKFTAPTAKILVVDDTVMNLTVVKGLLKPTKIKIETAESGYECLKLIEHKKFDIIFLDHRMPGIDGIETLKRMKTLEKNLNKKTPVISLTANAVSGARKMYLDAGFEDYLTKPIDSVKLEDLLIKYLPAEKIKFSEENGENSSEEEKIPNWLKDVSGLKIEDGIANCGGISAYMDALTVFAQSIISGAKEIAEFYKEGDIKNYTIKVHALKSSARVIGANELSEKAKRLEYAGNSGYINEIKKFTDGLLELYISFDEKLKPLIKTEENDDKKPLIDENSLLEAYEAMKEVASSFDYDSLQFVIQSLDEYKLPEDDAKKFAEIKKYAAKPDWEKVLKLLA